MSIYLNLCLQYRPYLNRIRIYLVEIDSKSDKLILCYRVY